MVRIIIIIAGLAAVIVAAVTAVADIGFRNKKHYIDCSKDSESRR